MQRDMDLVREILMELADSEAPLDARSLACDAHPLDEVAYHFELVIEAGLAKGSVAVAWDGARVGACLGSLTWEGNDFLDSVRDGRVWSRVKRAVGKAAGTASLETLKAVAVKVCTEAVLGQLQ